MRSVVAAVGLLYLAGLSVAADDKKNAPADPIQPKAVLKGTREFTRGPNAGKTVETELRVIRRDGATFTGTAIFAGRNSVSVTGTVKDGDIEWKEKYRSGNTFPTAVKGVVKEKKLLLHFKGSNPADGVFVEGDMTLELEEKDK